MSQKTVFTMSISNETVNMSGVVLRAPDQIMYIMAPRHFLPPDHPTVGAPLVGALARPHTSTPKPCSSAANRRPQPTANPWPKYCPYTPPEAGRKFSASGARTSTRRDSSRSSSCKRQLCRLYPALIELVSGLGLPQFNIQLGPSLSPLPDPANATNPFLTSNPIHIPNPGTHTN